MTTTALEISFEAGFTGAALKTQYLFKDKATATEVFAMLRDAATGYHARANDRERMVSFSHLAGDAMVDISRVVAFSSEAILEPEARTAFVEWEVGLSEMKAEGKCAAQAIEARRAGTPKSGSVEDESAVPEGNAPHA